VFAKLSVSARLHQFIALRGDGSLRTQLDMVYFRSWNSEIFSAITGLMGTVTGIPVPQKTEKFFWEGV